MWFVSMCVDNVQNVSDSACYAHYMHSCYSISNLKDLAFRFVKALADSGQVIPLYIASAENVADLGISQACLETFVVVNPNHCWLMSIIGDLYRPVSTTSFTLLNLYYIIYCECTEFTIYHFLRYKIRVPFNLNVKYVDSQCSWPRIVVGCQITVIIPVNTFWWWWLFLLLSTVV